VKKTLALVMIGTALTLACAAPEAAALPKRLNLVPEGSKVVATAIKNESVPVNVSFGALSGWADAAEGKAWIRIPVASLSTGDLTRDHNIKELFFEVAKSAGFATAEFFLDGVEGDLSALAQGKLLAANGRGRLKLHGSETALEGPVVFEKTAQDVKVSLKEGWNIRIDKAGLGKALAQLNEQCPQPHRVANVVTLSGELVFRP